MFFALSGQWCDTQQQWQELSYCDHVRLWCSNDHAYRLRQSPPAASYCVMPCVILFGNKIRNSSTCYTCCWNWWPIPLILQAKIFKNCRKLMIEIYMNVLCVVSLDKAIWYLVCLTPSNRNRVPAYAGSSPAVDWCPTQGESMTHPLIL